jgi:hypothetical protein
MVRITCINKDGGNHYNPYFGITHYGWINPSDGATGKSTRQEMVDFLVNKKGTAYVEDSYVNKVYCEVRYYENRPYIATVADGRETNNLLNLMECK